jgi:hypothetical protein
MRLGFNVKINVGIGADIRFCMQKFSGEFAVDSIDRKLRQKTASLVGASNGFSTDLSPFAVKEFRKAYSPGRLPKVRKGPITVVRLFRYTEREYDQRRHTHPIQTTRPQRTCGLA